MQDENTPPLMRIDENNLVEECVQLPTTYHEYAQQLAAAKKDLDEAKTHLDITKAQLGRDIRNNPGEYNLPKVTEGTVADAVMEHGRTKKAANAVSAARYRVDLLQAAVTALEHKKRMLESLVSLHGQSYFARVMPKNQSEREALDENMADATYKKVAAARNS